MDVERTIEFLLKNQARMGARFDAKFAKADERFAQAEKRLDRLERGLAENGRLVARNNRIVTQLARSGVALRVDVRKTEQNLARISESLSRMGYKLNALVDNVDRQIRGNGGHRGVLARPQGKSLFDQALRKHVNHHRFNDLAQRQGPVR